MTQSERDVEAALFGADGTYHASVGRTSWPLPIRVRLSDGCLLFDWELTWPGRWFDGGTASRSLLLKFLELRTGNEGKAIEFATRYGALGLCGHGLPQNHPSLQPGRIGAPDLCWATRPGLEPNAESISDWARYAQQAAALLELNARPYETLNSDQQVELATLDGWMALGGVGVNLRRLKSSYAIEVGNGTLFGAIAAQLMYVIAGGGRGLVSCSGCGQWFSPSRRPGPGKRSFCPKEACRTKAARALAARDYRLRNPR
jgi:hypothetical protein